MKKIYLIVIFLYLTTVDYCLVQAQTCPTISPSATTVCPTQPVTLTLSTPPFGAHIQWRRNGTAIAGANNITLNVTQEGNYDAQVVSEDWKRATDFQKPPISYSKAFFLDVNNGWMTGSNGVIFRTANGGGIWTRQETNSTIGLEGIFAISTNNVWAVGDNNLFRYNGTAWSSQPLGSQKLSTIHFESTGQVGLVVGKDGTVYRTTNGGANWNKIDLPSGVAVATANLNAVYVLNATTAVIVGDNVTFRTTNLNGASAPTWTAPLNGIPMGFEWRDVHFASVSNGWIVGTGGIFATTNGGINWVKQSDEKNPTFDVHFIDTQRGWAVGFAGTIARTTNGGTTWTVQRDIALGEYRGVAFAGNSTNGWAVNSYGMIWRTGDGAAWTPATDIASFEGIRFTDTNNGYLVGQNGLIFRTSDGGVNWIRVFNTTIQRLNDVYFIDSNNGWIACETGTLLRTTNAGANWTAQSVGGISSAFRAIFFANATNGWAAVSQGQVFATTNGGNSWTQQHTGSTTLNGIHLANTQVGGAVGLNARVITTNGSSWTSQSAPSQNLLDIHFTDAANAWTVGDNGVIAKSSNGGTAWTVQTSSTTKNLRAVHFVNATDGWASGTGGTIVSTQSGGNKWTEQSLGGGGVKSDDVITDITFINPTTGWAISNAGYVLKVNVVECITSPVTIMASSVTIEAKGNGLKPLSVCAGAVVSLSASAGFTSYSWRGPNFSSTSQNPSLPTPTSGIYSVTGTSACGMATDSIRITVNTTPPPIVSSSTISYCTSQSTVALAATGTALQWYTAPSGGIGSGTAPIPSTSTAGTSSYYVTQTLNTCESFPRTEIKVNVTLSPTISAAANGMKPLAACGNTPVTLTASTGFTSYSWRGPNFNSISQSPQLNNAVSGTYIVTGTSSCGMASDSVRITINPVPVTNARAGKSTYIVNETIELFAEGGGSYLWSGPNGFSSSQQNPKLTGATLVMGGEYIVSVTANGCTARGTVSITVTTQPVMGIENVTVAPSACPGTSVDVNFTIVPSNGVGIFNVYLIDANGQKIGTSIGSGTRSPIRATLPASATAGTNYRMLVETSPNITKSSGAFAVLQRATAQLLSPSKDTSIVARKTGDNLSVRVRVQGSGPFTLFFSAGARTVRNAGDTTLTFRLESDGIFSFQGISGACGVGSLSGIQAVNITLKRVVAIEEKEPEEWVTVFPNPFNSQIKLIFGRNEYLAQTELYLYDLNGKKLWQGKYQAFSEFWVLEWLTNGTYLLEVLQPERKTRFRLIKQ